MLSKSVKLSCIFLTISFCAGQKFTIDFPEKCAIKDEKCLINLFTTTRNRFSDIGIPEIGIPSINPYKIKNTTVNILGMVDFIITDGKVEGLTDCPLTKFEMNMDERYVISEGMCESIKMTSHYKVVVGPLVQLLTGNSVSGDGEGKIQIDKMTLRAKTPFTVQKHDDGEIYLVPSVSEVHYTTDDIELITFGATNVLFGNREISEPLIKYMNDNWERILRSFGKFFSDKVMETFYEYMQRIFLQLPAGKFISDDLTAYLRR